MGTISLYDIEFLWLLWIDSDSFRLSEPLTCSNILLVLKRTTRGKEWDRDKQSWLKSGLDRVKRRGKSPALKLRMVEGEGGWGSGLTPPPPPDPLWFTLYLALSLSDLWQLEGARKRDGGGWDGARGWRRVRWSSGGRSLSIRCPETWEFISRSSVYSSHSATLPPPASRPRQHLTPLRCRVGQLPPFQHLQSAYRTANALPRFTICWRKPSEWLDLMCIVWNIQKQE